MWSDFLGVEEEERGDLLSVAFLISARAAASSVLDSLWAGAAAGTGAGGVASAFCSEGAGAVVAGVVAGAGAAGVVVVGAAVEADLLGC